uniref:Uncharacterized protein n=1 Tax=Rhizophora mucronata TaxID=61149 RepID=A0A2P2IVC0_RHIMU
MLSGIWRLPLNEKVEDLLCLSQPELIGSKSYGMTRRTFLFLSFPFLMH